MRLTLFLLLLFAIGCTPGGNERIPTPQKDVLTYVPIYLSTEIAHKVEILPPKAIVNSGKIYALGNYLLQVEKDSGIHVIDYSNRTAPQKIGFIRSFYCSEMAVKNNHLYINNLSDLVVLNISNILQPVEVTRVKNAFPAMSAGYPPQQNVFFECPDPAQGIVVGWKTERRDYPKCYR